MDDLGHLYTPFLPHVGNVCSAGSCLVALLQTWTAFILSMCTIFNASRDPWISTSMTFKDGYPISAFECSVETDILAICD